ncbi:MAG: SpoIIE family protein phosphatase [Bacteroidota bacterium]
MAAPSAGTVDDPTDATQNLADPLGALVLALMSRLLATRAVGVRAHEDGFQVAVVKGRMDIAEGHRVGDLDRLTAWGCRLIVPLRYGDEVLGAVALGDRLGGTPYSPADTSLARSLATATAASLAARQSAHELAEANRALASRAQALRTLFELAQAFGRALDRDAIARRLTFALMGQLVVSRVAVALCDDDEGPLELLLTRGADPDDIPRRLARLDAPAVLSPDDDASLITDGWCVAVPLRAGDVTRGVVLLGERAAGTFDAEAADFAAALAALAVGALETADRVEEQVERERLREEVRLAREVQARLLPAALPTASGLDLAARWRPSRDVSGDTYHAVDLGRDRVLVAVADVVGKGIGASLLMATVQAGFRLVEPDLRSADDIGTALANATRRLNSLVAASTEPHQFVTLAWAVVEGHTIHAVVAGHPPPRLLRASGGIDELRAGGPLLGVLADASYISDCADLGSGDTLVLYTDGATEAQRADGEELDIEGFDRILRGSDATSAAALAEATEAAIDAWATGTVEDDDLTLVIVRRDP